MPHVTLHGLRHTHFTNLMRQRVNPKVVSERAGHASVAITLDIYSHVVPGLQDDAAAVIDGALSKLVEGQGGKKGSNADLPLEKLQGFCGVAGLAQR